MQLTLRSQGPLLYDVPFGVGAHRQSHVRAASAIVRFSDAWLVAQDDSNFAALWDARGLRPLRLFPDTHGDTYANELGNKQHKPDLECGTSMLLEGRPVAALFGSGSTPARRRAVLVEGTPASPRVRLVALDALYESAERLLGLSPGELNLEGACTVAGAVRFFQRGNAGPQGLNATFDLPLTTLARALAGDRVTPADLANARRYELGLLAGAPLGFSAAQALPDGRVLFAATAEASPNTYDDGACTGSVIGLLAADGALAPLMRLPPDAPAGAKIEGLAVEETLAPGWRLLAVTDADDPARPSVWLRLDLAR